MGSPHRLGPELGAFPGASASFPVSSLVLSDLGLFICQVGIRIPALSVLQGKSQEALMKGKHLVNNEALWTGLWWTSPLICTHRWHCLSKCHFHTLAGALPPLESPVGGGGGGPSHSTDPRATPGTRPIVQTRNPSRSPERGCFRWQEPRKSRWGNFRGAQGPSIWKVGIPGRRSFGGVGEAQQRRRGPADQVPGGNMGSRDETHMPPVRSNHRPGLTHCRAFW